MNKRFDPEQVGPLLDRSLSRIKQPTLERLRDARMQALARYDAHSTATAPAFAWAGRHAHTSHGAHGHRKAYYWAGALLLAACLFSGAAYWQHATGDHDTSAVDLAILTDDMPMHVYVD